MTTRAAITTPFTTRSTAVDVIAGTDLTGRRAVATGAASGIGGKPPGRSPAPARTSPWPCATRPPATAPRWTSRPPPAPNT